MFCLALNPSHEQQTNTNFTDLWVALPERWVALSLISGAGTRWGPAAPRCTASSSPCSPKANRTPGWPTTWSARTGWSDWWCKTGASSWWRNRKWCQGTWCHWGPRFCVPGARRCPTPRSAWSRPGWRNRWWGWGPPLCGRTSRSETWACSSVDRRESSAPRWSRRTCRWLGGARRCRPCWRPQRCSRRKLHTLRRHCDMFRGWPQIFNSEQSVHSTIQPRLNAFSHFLCTFSSLYQFTFSAYSLVVKYYVRKPDQFGRYSQFFDAFIFFRVPSQSIVIPFLWKEQALLSANQKCMNCDADRELEKDCTVPETATHWWSLSAPFHSAETKKNHLF